MKMFGYGEDALTLWALANRLGVILEELGDDTDPSACQVFYRPSFGRRGGERRSEFGEFDFIILAGSRLYLSESKWDQSSERIKDGLLELRPEQTRRHEVFRFYLEHWAYGGYSTWPEFVEKAQPLIAKRLARDGTRLASNLQTVLGVIKEHYPSQPVTSDVLLYLYGGEAEKQLPQGVGGTFELVCIDYSAARRGNFIELKV